MIKMTVCELTYIEAKSLDMYVAMQGISKHFDQMWTFNYQERSSW